MTYPVLIFRVLLIAITTAAAIYDIRYRRIPNWLTVTGVVSGLAFHAFLFEMDGLAYSAKGLGFALLVYFPLFALRGMGAGDVKLMAAVGSLVGPWNWLGIFVVTGILGGVFGVILALSRGRLRRTFWNATFILNELAHFRIPYFSRQELDVGHPDSLRLPHGAVIALGSYAFLAVGAIWAPR